MQAIFLEKYGPASVLRIGTVSMPRLRDNDVLIKNLWAGINPIDYKIRQGGRFEQPIDSSNPRILGWDGAGVVQQIGPDVTGFQIGDEVYYAGDALRNGSYAQYTAVDSRIVAKKPSSLNFDQAAAVPLVAITCWEAMVEDFRIEAGQKVLIYNGAGGVGSFAIQLAKCYGGQVCATASRQETSDFCKQMGAEYVLNHHDPLKPQIQNMGLEGFDFIFTCYDPRERLLELIDLLNPCGKISLITFRSNPEVMAKIDTGSLSIKCQSISFRSMFMRTYFNFQPDKQGQILKKVAEMIDKGAYKSTVTKKFEWNEIAQAHELLQSEKSIGKAVIHIPEADVEP
eukprot:TRINITY_DN5390_c0_g1_i3.p1 TRINITY_DN5390_c0_g1~~TRINITY_DN5390_c0_g1_i3.p1  ORF type:complete len:341 (-),score=36.90 TRINITY_DN5390_c0_g1_i3:572-1594(-)